MKRDLSRLADQQFDVLVVGSGIYGAFIAWDAALRGLSVALIDRGDFGSGTSANSAKTIHGGLRYLQDGNLQRVRIMSRERTTWMQIAPHLVHPMPCLLPTNRKLSRSRMVLAAGLFLSDLMSYDRNRLDDPEKSLPRSQIISRSECLRRLPGIQTNGITGGAIWYDAQMFNSERLLLAIVLSAAQCGAVIANYVAANRFLRKQNAVTGIQAKDVLTGAEFDIQAKVVMNCTGIWVNSLTGTLDEQALKPRFIPSIAMNIVTRQILPGFAAGIPSKYFSRDHTGQRIERSRLLFMVPWRQYSIIGTIHMPVDGDLQDYRVSESSIHDFLEEINRAYPGASLRREDVYHLHYGFLPAIENNHRTNTVKLVRESRVHDHEKESGISGLITVVGVKYTTARITAQKAVDLIVKKLGLNPSVCRTHETAVYGGMIDQFDDFLLNAVAKRPFWLDPEIVKHLVYTYGSNYSRIVQYQEKDDPLRKLVSSESQVTKAEVVHAVCEEMALKLTDVVLRRTELGSAGMPSDLALQVCAEVMGELLGWSELKKDREIAEVKAVYLLGE